MASERYADKLISEAIERGELEPQQGVGEPLGGLSNDPDWWIRAFMNREAMPERFAEMQASVHSRIGQAISASELTAAREMLAEVNADIARWNNQAEAPFRLDERSEVWLLSERARRPAG